MNTAQDPARAAPLSPPASRLKHAVETAMATCLGAMAVAVFVNVVLRYGFGAGIAASEEVSRLLFVWMVFIGATAAYPAGEHMAFTSLVGLLQERPRAFAAASLFIHALVVLGCALLVWGAWQQVVVGSQSRSVVLGYPASLLPLPALLCALSIGVMALGEMLRGKPLALHHAADVE